MCMYRQLGIITMSCSRKPRKCKQKGSFSWKKTSPIVLSNDGKLPKLSLMRVIRESSNITSDYSSCSSLSSISENSIYNSSLGSTECISYFSDKDTSDFELDEVDNKKGEINTRRTRTIQCRNVTVIIPEENLSGVNRDDFYLEFIEDPAFLPSVDSRMVYVSYIVSIGPHGSRFYPDKPALIYLPLTEKVQDEDKIICLCSNTPKETSPKWEEMPRENYTLKNGRIVIKAQHFSLFTVVVERLFPEFSRKIDAVAGGSLRLPEVPGVEVNFPPRALVSDVTAIVRVLYDWDPGHSLSLDANMALASPVIMVGPHGCCFNPGSQSVTVRLPIPHYQEIQELIGRSSTISVWQSSTSENEPLVWERLDVEHVIERDNSGLFTVTFPVSHFSFFKSIWDILSSSLYEAKLGLAFFYPYISFSMMCQAWMEENKDTQRFGLEVICYRSDNKLPEATNYKYKVGSSLKPKLVRPGCIVIRLKSELFDADVEAGEDVDMTKEEPDFRGREFEKQFACRFKQNKQLVERGTFGKVIVERRVKSGRNEPLFEFNLHKTGHETEPVRMEGTDRWSVVAITELAGTLQITEDNNWKKFARHIGFTKNEINHKLTYSADPFLAMVNLYQSRGGTPEEFVQALYAVSRQIRIQGSNASSSPGSSSGASTSRRWPNIFKPMRWRDGDSDSDSVSAASASTNSRKRSHDNSGASSGRAKRNLANPAKRKRKNSEVSETMSSSEESSTLDTNDPANNRKLKDTDMWGISEFMNTQNWRALGRTLGLEETVLLNIEHTYKATGFRECAYQMLLQWKERRPAKCTVSILHHALQKEKMNSVAKQLSTMKLGE